MDAKDLKFVPFPYGGFYLEAMDSHGGLIGSAQDLIKFCEAYWISGRPRKGSGFTYTFFGSLPGTYAMAYQHPSGYNVVTLFNQRQDDSKKKYDVIKQQMKKAIEQSAGPS